MQSQISRRGCYSRCMVVLSANQALAAGFQNIRFDQVLYDELNEFNTATYQFTPVRDGYYAVTVVVKFNNPSAIVDQDMVIRFNGGPPEAHVNRFGRGGAFQDHLALTVIDYCEKGGSIETLFSGTVGGNATTLIGGTFRTFISVHRLS